MRTKRTGSLRTAKLLMTASIVLLVLLQAYWLRNAWFDEYRRLKRELSVILRESVMKEEFRRFMVATGDTGSVTIKDTFRKRDITILRGDNGKKGGRTSINIAVNADSGSRHFAPPRFFNFEEEKQLDDFTQTSVLVVDFPVPPNYDRLEAVRRNYTKALQDAGIDLGFTMVKTKGDSTKPQQPQIRLRKSGNNKPEHVRFFTADNLEARFHNPFMLLLHKIQWQLLFASIMLLVTATAFIFLFRNLKAQQKLAAIKNDFIANITHELKTPIATVSVAIEALKNFEAMHDKARTREYLDISGNELKRLNLLVDKVLKLSMLGEHKLVLQKEPLDVAQLMNEVLNSMKLQFEKQGAKIHYDKRGENLTLQADRLHLLSVFYNLLDNALKYSPEDPVIGVELIAEDKQVVIKVQDNGIGIAQEDHGKIFDKFFRVPHGNMHNIKGHGLGLSYVQEVILAHNGSITVQSSPAKGSTFIVILKR